MTVLRTCDVCKVPHLTTARYGVNRQRKANGEHRTWGAGGIDLCDPCWSRICQPKQLNARARRLTGSCT